RNGVTREHVVVVAAIRQVETLRSFVVIAHQQRVDVVRSTFLVGGEVVEDPPRERLRGATRLGHHREIRRRRSAHGFARLALRGEGRGPAVGGDTGTHALLGVGIDDLVFGGQRFDLLFRKLRPAWFAEVAERDQPEAVATRAYLAVDLKAALQLVLIEGAEDPGERPGLLLDLHDAVTAILLCRHRR